MQYQSECLSALKSVVNIHKPFEKTFMDAMKLFMAIPDRINFLQLGRTFHFDLLFLKLQYFGKFLPKN